jgi:CheY-like chemotaxis protein
MRRTNDPVRSTAAASRSADALASEVCRRFEVFPQAPGFLCYLHVPCAGLRARQPGLRVAASVRAALRHFHQSRPTVAVSHIGMRGEDGHAFLEQLPELPASAGGNVPAVALSADARSEDRTRALLAGFTHHLPKPVEPMELLAVVDSLAGRTGKRTG